jgi:hypothetical protein
LALSALSSGKLPMKARVSVLFSFLLSTFTVLIAFASQWICLHNIVVSLANALSHSSALETKLKASTKALGEADKKRADKVAATKLAADQAVKEAEARATKAEKTLDKISKKQSQCEEAIIKCIDYLLTAFGSKYHLIVSSLVFPLLFTCSQWLLFRDAAEQLGQVIRLCEGEAKDSLLDGVGLLESNCRNVRNVSSALDMCFPVCLPGCS